MLPFELRLQPLIFSLKCVTLKSFLRTTQLLAALSHAMHPRVATERPFMLCAVDHARGGKATGPAMLPAPGRGSDARGVPGVARRVHPTAAAALQSHTLMASLG